MPVMGRKANEVRRDTRTPKQLLIGRDQLDYLGGKLQAFAEAMEKEKVREIKIDSATKLERGVKLIEGYVKAVRKALVDADVEVS